MGSAGNASLLTAEDLVSGRYRIVERLGQGSVGDIYVASEADHRVVVLRHLRPGLMQSEEFLKRVEAAAALQHPHLENVVGLEPWEGMNFLVSEYADGRDLSACIKAASRASKPIPYGITARLVHDAALGLAFAHANGFVHRHMSLNTIIAETAGTGRVVDLGFLIADGRPGYRAPERANDASGDQFALGVIAWEMLVMRRLFGAVEGAPDSPPMTPLEADPNVPPLLNDICMRMLARDPIQRYSGLDDAAVALVPHCASAQETSTFIGGLVFDSTAIEVTRRPSRSNFVGEMRAQVDEVRRLNRQRWQLALGALLVVMVLAAIVAML